MMRLTVVLTTRNAASTIGAQLEALCRQEWRDGWEVIVADNGSTDKTRDVVRTYSGRLPGLRVIEASDAPGVSHARNLAVRAATGDALLFCDDDDEVGEGWLAAMGRSLLRYPLAACQTEVHKLNPSWLAESRGSSQSNGLQRLPYPPHLPHAGGGTLGVWRALFEALGGFDEDFLRVQDAFFCVRAQLSGITLQFVPEAVVHVRHPHTPVATFRQARGWGEYSTLLYRRMRELGLPPLPRPIRDSLAAWRSLIRSLPSLAERAARIRWVFRLGYRVGRLRGSFKYRVLAP